MKKYIFTFVALMVVLIAAAQSSNESKVILDRAYAAYSASDGVKLSFSLAVQDAKGRGQSSETGEAMAKGNKFKIETNTADIWYDGITQWVLSKDAKEVYVSQPSGDELATVSPLALLSLYKKGYAFKAPVSKTVNGRPAYVIDMEATDKKGDFTSIAVAIDKQSNSILQVILVMRNGMKNKIDIERYNANYRFADQDFIFDKAAHKGVEIVDLR